MEIVRICEVDRRLSLVIARYGDLSFTLHTDEFAFIVETIIGQMLSNKVADVITNRFYTLCGNDLSPAVIDGLEQQSIRGIGLSAQKTAYIKGFSSLILAPPISSWGCGI
jgi:DNA-3-methyladenine glycosylase II